MKKYILLLVLSAISLTGFAQFANEGTVYANEKKSNINKGEPFVFSPRIGAGIGGDKGAFSFTVGVNAEVRLIKPLWLSSGVSANLIEFEELSVMVPLSLKYKYEWDKYGFNIYAGSFYIPGASYILGVSSGLGFSINRFTIDINAGIAKDAYHYSHDFLGYHSDHYKDFSFANITLGYNF